MDRFVAMLLLLVLLSTFVLILLAIFAVAPVFCSCLISLLYTLYLFIANEWSGVHHAQEFENRFWTIFALLFSTALFFANDSPVAIGLYSPSIGFLGVLIGGFGMHVYDRHAHRIKLCRDHALRRGTSAAASLNRLKALGIPVEEQLATINSCLRDIDQLLIPSTINNLINIRFILQKEREIISILEEVHPRALNYLIQHIKLGLLFYKVKDHKHLISGRHRTELIELLAVTRLSALNVLSRVNVLDALQVMNIQAHARSEFWVKNIILRTNQDDLSELKSLTDAKGDYACMNQLIYNDIRTESIRRDILNHLNKEAKVQQAHMSIGTKKSKIRAKKAWRKILSDVDDTLYCSGGHYPAGIDKRYANKVVYPGVLAFYRELDLGTNGEEEWPSNAVGNLVFLSARPHVYKDLSEAGNHSKFEKLKTQRSMHTTPSLLTGDLTSGRHFIVSNDMEPLAVKKFQNFKRYVSIYPEFKHVFIGDNGQGDVRAAELMNKEYPKHLEAVYMHKVQHINKTFGYDIERYHKEGFKPYFFLTYIDAAIDAAITKKPPLILIGGLRRVCEQAVHDFHMIMKKQWHSEKNKWDRRDELNQGLWKANQYLKQYNEKEVPLIDAEQIWNVDDKVNTPYGLAKIVSFDPIFDMYKISIDWSPLDVQVEEFKKSVLQSQQQRQQQSTMIDDKSNINITNTTTTARTAQHHVSKDINTKERQEYYEEEDEGVPSCIKPFLRPRCEEQDEESSSLSFPKEVKVNNNNKNDLNDVNRRQDGILEQGSFAEDTTTIGDGPTYADVSSLPSSPLIRNYNPADNTVASDVTDDAFVLNCVANNNNSVCTTGNLKNNHHNIGTNNNSTALGLEQHHQQHEVDMSEKNHFIVFATVHRSCISKYVPPVLPPCYHDALPSTISTGRSIFSFFGSSADNKSNKDKDGSSSSATVQFNVGDNVQTLYGVAVVKEYQSARNIVIVNMSGWNAIGYLQKDQVQAINKGLFGSLFRKLSNLEGDGTNATAATTVSITTTNAAVALLPLSKGTKLNTPFGEGIVVIPLSQQSIKQPSSHLVVDSSKSETPLKRIIDHPPHPSLDNNNAKEEEQQQPKYSTIGISLVSWTLANKSNPILYCTTDVANQWLHSKNNEKNSNIIASVLSKLSTALTIGRATPTTTPNISNTKSSSSSQQHQSSKKKHEQQKHEIYFKNGAAVTTSFGNGVVQSFRNKDGFYKVLLSDWNAIAYLQKRSLSQIATGCIVGQPVLTMYGLTGILESIDPTTGIHIVSTNTSNNHNIIAIMHLQPNAITRPLKSAVGETVSTLFGQGIIQHFRPRDSIYIIKIKNAIPSTKTIINDVLIYANENSFDRIINDEKDDKNSNNDKHHWLWKYLYFNSKQTATATSATTTTNTTTTSSTSTSTITSNNNSKIRSRSNTIGTS